MANYQEYTTRIFLNDEQAQSKIDNLRNSIKRYQADKQAALNAGGKEGDKAWKEADRNIRKAEAELKKLSTTSQSVNRVLSHLDTSSIKDIRQTIKAINREMASGSIARGSAEWKALNAQLVRAKTELASIEAESAAMGKDSFFSNLADGINKYWGIIAQAIAGIAMLTLSIRKSTQAYADMEEVMADVRKYTGQTTEEIHAMNEEFKVIDTRTSREELNKLAGAAGRLGITAHDDIMAFVDAADKIDVALGEDLGQDAVQNIGKLAMAFGEDDRMGLRGAMLASGSAVNELSQNSSASASYLVDFTARLAGVGQVAGMTQAQIMGLGSVMDENMQRDEMASTALSNLITKLATDSSKFAKIAGIDVKEFADLVENDMNAALLKFAKTLQGKGGLMKLAPMFAEMGLDGSRAVGVLTVLANKVDDVRKNQELANKAYDEGVSIINEFNVQNTTVQAEIDKNIKVFNDLSVQLGEKLLPIVKYTVTSGSLLVKTLSAMIDFTVKYRTTIVTLTVAVVALNAAKLKDIALSKLQVFWNDILVKGCKKLYAVLLAHPYLAIAGAVATFAAAIIDLTRKTDDAARRITALDKANKKADEEFANQASVVDSLNKVFRESNNTLNTRNEALAKLKKIIPEYNAELTKEGKIINDNNEVIKAYLLNLEKQIKLKAAQEELEQSYRDKRLKEKDITKKEAALRKAEEGTGDVIVGGESGVEEQRLAYQRVISADNALKKSKAELVNINKDIEELVKEINSNTTNTIVEVTDNVQQSTAEFVSEKKMKAEQLEDKRKKMAADKAERAALNQHLADLTALYGKGEISYTEFLKRQADLQLQSIAKRKAIWGAESNEAKQLADDEMKVMQRYADKRLRQKDIDIERERATTEAKLHAMYYDRNSTIYMNEDALNEALFRNDMDALDKMMAARNAGSEQWQQLKARKEQESQEHKYSNEIAFQERLQQMREQFGEYSSEQEMQIALNGLDELHKRGLVSEEEYQKMLLQIRGYYAVGGPGYNNEQFNKTSSSALSVAKMRAGDAANPESDTIFGAMFGADLQNYRNVNEQIALMEKEGVITHAQANQAKAMNDAEYLDTLLSRTKMMYDMVNNVVSAAAAYSKASSDLEVKNIEKSYDKQIKAAGKNSARRKKLEEKRDEDIRRARNKANNKAVKIEIAQAIATSAMSALDAYASVIKALPYPANMAIAPVAAGMALAAGALQIATIRKQHEAQKEGYYEGGFTSGSNYHRSAGIVHEGEFVANHNAVNNAAILPALQLIDEAQRNNTVASLTAEDITRAVGSSSAAPVVNVIQDTAQLESLRQTQQMLINTVMQLQKKLDDGIYAFTTIDGDYGIKKQLDKYNRLIRNK